MRESARDLNEEMRLQLDDRLAGAVLKSARSLTDRSLELVFEKDWGKELVLVAQAVDDDGGLYVGVR